VQREVSARAGARAPGAELGALRVLLSLLGMPANPLTLDLADAHYQRPERRETSRTLDLELRSECAPVQRPPLALRSPALQRSSFM
jgi:hypothetical protein